MLPQLLGVALAVTSPSQLQEFNRTINHLVPLVNEPVRWIDEGVDGYDCKGFVRIKGDALEFLGVSYDRMSVLITEQTGTRVKHAVLEVDGVVLDNLSSYLNKPSDYIVTKTLPFKVFVLMYNLNPYAK